MELQDNFLFLKLEQMQRKNSEELKESDRYFFVIHLLDKDNNPCRFFIFNKDLREKVLKLNLVGLQNISVTMKVSFVSNSWQVNLLDIN